MPRSYFTPGKDPVPIIVNYMERRHRNIIQSHIPIFFWQRKITENLRLVVISDLTQTLILFNRQKILMTRVEFFFVFSLYIRVLV